jgi:Flp pilus assembly protein TadD
LDASTEASTPAVTEEPAEPAVSAPAGVSPQETQAAADPAPSESPEPVLASQPVEEAVVAEQTPEAEPVPETPVFRGQPTAANMTERGIWLFNQGRIQESIDQFTKALALDVDFKEAWEHRAEAYSRLGRGEQAAEDRRRLQAINAGSSSN